MRDLIGIMITKGVDSRIPVEVSIVVDIDGIGRADVTLTGDEFTRVLAGTMLPVDVEWRPDNPEPVKLPIAVEWARGPELDP